jgi:hypothetical protein
MRSKIVLILAMAAFALSACDRRADNSDGNGPGNADGFGGRADPPAQHQPAEDQPVQDEPASEQQPQQ